MQYARAAYSAASRLALELKRYCAEHGLSCAASCCCLAVARASAGTRDFATAHDALADASSRLEADQDACNHAASTCALIEVLLGQGDIERARTPDLTAEAVAAPASVVGEFYALRALAHAVAADVHAAERDAATAIGLSRGLEASRYADLAQAIAGCSRTHRDPGPARRRALQSIHATASAEFPHAFVLAARLRPDLLAVVERDPGARRFAFEAFRRSGDTVLAKALEPDLCRAWRRVGSLTPRETEVLALLGEGCTNADIARRLVIASSTARVHVHRVRRKLGARNRVEAALMSRDLVREAATAE